MNIPVGDFSASVVESVQLFSKEIIGNINDFSRRVVNVTNPPPSEPYTPPSYTGGDGKSDGNIGDTLPDNTGNSGGYDSSCACVSAGCACACAGSGR